jgi:tetratricopeptide (TPR) repeat protein/predicted Ser/Thr protein kinase
MVGTTVLQYRVLSQLGSGGMGIVYEAEDTKLGRRVALKFLPESLGFSPDAAERFQREAKLAGSLNHPNICTIHDSGIHEGRHFFVMEMLDGDSLKTLIHGNPLPLEQILDVGCQIAGALEAAHAKGIVHRDIKPANIFITTHGQAKLLDFGVATAGHAHPAALDDTHIAADVLTSPGSVIGSVNYMSPEQARGEALDGRTDLFSLGLVLYEMATGRQAFGGQTTAVVFDAILNRDPVPAREVNPAIPSELEHVISRALEKDRKMRYQTAADMLSELSRLRRDTTGRTAATTPASTTVAAAQPAGRSRAILLGVAAIAVLGIAGYLYWNSTTAPAPLTPKDQLLIADFANTTGDPVFDDALRQAVAVQLQQTPFITLVPDLSVQRTLRLMARPADERLTSSLARDLCQRAGAKATVEGSIAPLGSSYVITIGVHNCETGAPLAQEQIQAASKEQVLAQVGTALTALRKGLGESLASIEKYDVPITEATTSSLDALKAYSEGGKARGTRGDEAAIPYYEQAITLDPNFALAYAKLGVVFSNTGQVDNARAATQKAYDLRDRVSEYERLYITWSHATRVLNDQALAKSTLEMMTAAYPRDFTSRNNLGVLLIGQARFEDALKEYMAAIEIAPQEPLPMSNAAYALLFLDRYDEGLAMIDRAMAVRPNPGLAMLRWMSAALRGDPRAAEFENTARELAPPPQFLTSKSALAIWEGRLKDYASLIDQARTHMRANPDPSAVLQLDASEIITMAVLQRGPWVARLKALGTRADLPPQGVIQVASALAIVGEIDAVRPLLARIEKADRNDPNQAQPSIVVRALVESEAGRLKEATGLIETYLVQNPRALDLHYYLGLVRERSGLIDDAIASYRLAVRGINLLGPSPAIIGAKVRLGLLLKQKGDTAGANAVFDDLLKQWNKADADFELLKVVKANR